MIKAIQNSAQEALRQSHIYDLRDLRVEQIDDKIMISGKVKTFYHKQLAQEAVRNVSPEVEVINEVAVDVYDSASTI